MPFTIRKVAGGYKVDSPFGPKSKKPMTRERAGAQLRASEMNYHGRGRKR